MAEPVKVTASRAEGAAPGYVLRAKGHEGAWFVRQLAFLGEEFVPYWYEEDKLWHIWEGEAEGEGAPLVSVESLGAARAYVGGLVSGPGAAG